VNRIIDSIYGSISFTVNKSKKQLINEAKINTVINKLDADANEQITDDFSRLLMMKQLNMVN
jgi:uncharacterized lipoprotein